MNSCISQDEVMQSCKVHQNWMYIKNVKCDFKDTFCNFSKYWSFWLGLLKISLHAEKCVGTNGLVVLLYNGIKQLMPQPAFFGASARLLKGCYSASSNYCTWLAVLHSQSAGLWTWNMSRASFRQGYRRANHCHVPYTASEASRILRQSTCEWPFSAGLR